MRGLPPSMMAGFDGRIRDEDIWNIVNYLRTLASTHPHRASPMAALRARRICYSGSMVARSGNPFSRAILMTVFSLVSATSREYTPQSPWPCMWAAIMIR
jgi:hypothetical protein